MIKSIEIHGFQSHLDTQVDLGPGINTIIGDSNAGKTGIHRAIRWVMENRPSTTKVVMKKEVLGKVPDTLVRITTDKGVVERVKEKGFNGYRVCRGDEQLTFKEVGSTVPPEVFEVLNLGDINVQRQDDATFLVTESPGKISRYVSDLLGLDLVDKAVASARAEASRVEAALTSVEAGVESMSEELGRLSFLDEVQDLLGQADIVKSQLDAASSQVAQVNGIVATLEECEEAVAPLRAKVDAINLDDVEKLVERVGQLQAARQSLSQAVDLCQTTSREVEEAEVLSTSAASTVEAAKEEYEVALAELGLCPYCGGVVEKDHLHEVVQGLGG